MKRKSIIAVTILFLAIGFAAISTTLIINGSTEVGENTDDFSVIFTAASLDGTDVYKNVISQDKKNNYIWNKWFKNIKSNKCIKLWSNK